MQVPQPIMAEYYGQRATKGSLFISEGTVVHRWGHVRAGAAAPLPVDTDTHGADPVAGSRQGRG